MLLAVFAFTNVAWAGSAHRHRMEGLAWGLGAAILGKVILDSQRRTYTQPAYVVEEYRHHYTPSETSGHWELQRQWVPPKFEQAWNPGHYNQRGEWIRGRWIRIQTEHGYWQEKEVWIPHY
jgi:hypothetical protein